MIKMDTEFDAAEIGDEDFIERVSSWTPDRSSAKRSRNRKLMEKVKAATDCRKSERG